MCAPTWMCPYRHAHTNVTRTDTCRQPFARVHADAPCTYMPMRCPVQVCVCARSCERCLNAHVETCTCKHTHTRVGSAPCRGTGTRPACSLKARHGDVGVLTSPPLRHRPDRERGVRDPAPTAPTSPHFPAALKTQNSFWLPSKPLLPAASRTGTPRSTCPRTAQCLSVPPASHAGCCRDSGGNRRVPRPRKLCPARGWPVRGEGLSGGTRSCSRAAKGWGRCCGSELGQG